MSDDESISFAHNREVLRRYPIYMALPESLDGSELLRGASEVRVAAFSDPYFATWQGYNLLCCASEFYHAFRQYDYILICQLDCFVLRDELYDWCGCEFDYVGAPWPNYEHLTESKRWFKHIPGIRLALRRSGQGGFSLRKTRTFECASRRLAFLRPLQARLPEDVFWSTIGSRLYRPFRMAGFEDSLRFCFDASPELCYKLNNYKLPFACHGWFRHGAEFWNDKITSTRSAAPTTGAGSAGPQST